MTNIAIFLAILSATVALTVAVLALINSIRNPPPKKVTFSGEELNAVHWAIRKQLDQILPTHPRHDALYAAKERVES